MCKILFWSTVLKFKCHILVSPQVSDHFLQVAYLFSVDNLEVAHKASSICNLNYVFFKFYCFFFPFFFYFLLFFLNQLYFHTFVIYVIQMFLRVWRGGSILCVLSPPPPHQTQVQVNKNIIKTKKLAEVQMMAFARPTAILFRLYL